MPLRTTELRARDRVSLGMSAFVLLWLMIPAAALAQAAEPAASAASAAIQQLRPGWQVLHCGVARGVLYVTYADRGQAAITPAVPNALIVKACASAGFPVAASTVQRSGGVALQPPPPARPAGQGGAAAGPANRSQPSFTPLALGSSLAIDARNDSDISWHCTVNFSWTADDSGGPRSATAQATLPPHQNNRVADVSGGYRNLRFVGSPSGFCNPAE